MAGLLPQEELESATEVQKLPTIPVEVELWGLDVSGNPASGSPYIIKDDEAMSLSMKVKFGGGTLTDLLMCVGIKIDVTFAIEGFGTAAEINLGAPTVTTENGVYEYTPKLMLPGGPKSVGLVPGVYKAAAAMTVKPASPCADVGPFAFGYLSDVVFQVYTY